MIELALATTFAMLQMPDVSPTVVVQKGAAYPAVSVPLWSDEGINLYGFTPSVDALIGYNPNPSEENLTLGYSLVLNRPVTENTWLFFGVGKIGSVREIRFDNLVEEAALVFGVRLKI